MTPQLIFKFRNIADFGIDLRLVARNSAIAEMAIFHKII
jgi:hypothetical protein